MTETEDNPNASNPDAPDNLATGGRPVTPGAELHPGHAATKKELARQAQEEAILNRERERLAAQQEIRRKTGRALAVARAEKKYNLEYVSETLRIPQRYLQKIEAGEMDGLPGVAYYIGFTRSYAKLLGLDSDALVKELSESLSAGDRNPEYHFVDSETEEKNRLGLYILGGAGVLLIIYILWYLIASSAVNFPSFLSVNINDPQEEETIVVAPLPLDDAATPTPATAVARPTSPEVIADDSPDDLPSNLPSDSPAPSFGSALDPVFDSGGGN